MYAAKLRGIELPLKSLEQLAELPTTTKAELLAADADDAANLTFAREQYVRYHQTSGTHGQPMPVLDTAADWNWWVNGWQYVLDSAGVTAHDHALMAFSFGPFIGFWTAHAALVQRGCLVVPGGGLSTLGRLALPERTQATVLLCTPSYALHLAAAQAESGGAANIDSVRALILAGEPGGSIPATRARLADA